MSGASTPSLYFDNLFTIDQANGLEGRGIESSEPVAVEQPGFELDGSGTLQSRIDELESCLLEQQKVIDQLDGRLDEASLKCRVLEYSLDHHKDMILLRSEELKQRDQTIGAQECLLGLALADAQNTMSAGRGTPLQRYIEGALGGNGSAEGSVNKKRRLM